MSSAERSSTRVSRSSPSLDASICAHSVNGQTVCSRCIDACPAEAIVSIGERIEVNPNLCQGGGSCATVCPSGAIRYRYPNLRDNGKRLRDMLAPEYSAIIYNGFWFSPEMDFLMSAIDRSQEVIDGTVNLKLYKGNVVVTGRTSPSSLYDRELSSMDIEGGFNQQDSEGFIRIHALRLMAHHAIMARGRASGEE